MSCVARLRLRARTRDVKADEIAVQIASQSHGLITGRTLAAAGIPSHHARSRCDQGRWERMYRNVFRIAGTPVTYEQRLLAACLAVPRGAVASHRAAAELWQLAGIDRHHLEVTVQQANAPLLGGVTVHRTQDLRPGHVTRHRNIPVTNPMRTIVDLGAVCPRWVVREAMDDALGRKLVSVAGLVRIWKDVARPGRSGSGVLRSLLEEHLPRPYASKLEKAMLRLHRRHELPEPETEVNFHDDAGFIGRVDFYHRDAKVIIEVDGYEKRTSMRAFARDRSRDRRLHALGNTVLRYVWFEVVHTPRDVAREIAPFLSQSTQRE